jgi:hypothetical protein
VAVVLTYWSIIFKPCHLKARFCFICGVVIAVPTPR